jgi:hypothetical protein
MQLSIVKKGDPLSADEQNKLIQKVNELLERQNHFNEMYIHLFELTGDPVIPSGSGTPITTEPTIYAKAKKVYCHKFSASAGNTQRTYKTQPGETVEVDLWFPIAVRDSNGYGQYCGYAEGDLVLGRWNRQSGRWEAMIEKPSLRLAWATTTAAVAPGDSTFTVTDIVPCDGSSWNGDDPLTVQNTPLKYSLDDAHQILIRYIAKHDGSGDWAWYPADASCCAACECDCTA